MALDVRSPIDRRTLLIGGGAGLGLLVAWAAWPRSYPPNLTADPGESLFGAWLKIGADGHVTVAVPQCEEGQGVYTAMPQIVADELGADWRFVGVEPAPLNPLYANALAAETLFEAAYGRLPAGHATRMGMMLTGGSTSIRSFEGQLKQAGAAARVLLCKAAARRWKVDWQACTTANSMVIHGGQRLGFGPLAAEAAEESLPGDVPLRSGGDGTRLYGQPLPRLDAPAKTDGTAVFAGDIRLPNMVYASIRQGPDRRNRARADRPRRGRQDPRHARGGDYRSMGRDGGEQLVGGGPRARRDAPALPHARGGDQR